MQKDIHYNLTFALACKVGICREVAERIAWANQFTDELTAADLHGLQTQTAILGNWKDRQVQATVLVPFHFLPGNDKDNPYVATQHSQRSKILIGAAFTSKDPIQFGIALHTLQDTFSHQGFTGWEEKYNSCFDFTNLWAAGTPNVGHADMRTMPDMVNITWTDPRIGELIDNKIRAYQAAKATFDYLVKFYGKEPKTDWRDLEKPLRDILAHKTKNPKADYDLRKVSFLRLSGKKILSYSQITERMQRRYKGDFVRAAQKHLSVVMKSLPTE